MDLEDAQSVTGVKDFATGTLKLDGATLSSLLAAKSPSAGLWLPGAIGNFVTCPDAGGLDIVGDLDVRVKVARTDWTPAATQVLMTKNAVGSNFSWYFATAADGKLQLWHTSDGVTVKIKQSTVATGFTDGTTHWVCAVLDVDNGASGYNVLFYTSDDGEEWTQLGTTVTTATTTSIFSGTGTITVGGNFDSGAMSAGVFHRAQIRSGIDGTLVADWRADIPAARYRDEYGNLWTVGGTANAWMAA
jgi:hypothetical protein